VTDVKKSKRVTYTHAAARTAAVLATATMSAAGAAAPAELPPPGGEQKKSDCRGGIEANSFVQTPTDASVGETQQLNTPPHSRQSRLHSLDNLQAPPSAMTPPPHVRSSG
jgi:hypothetical protein